MKQTYFYYLIILLILPISLTAQDKKALNVVFIAVDDMNNWIGEWKGLALTPNIDQLAKEGIPFKNAHCAAPACNPSRASLFTGLRPESTGVYGNYSKLREQEGGKNSITLPQFLRSKGYDAIAAGKLFHSPRGNGEKPNSGSDPVSWDYQLKTEIGTPWTNKYYDNNKSAKWLNGDTLFNDLEIVEYLRRTGIWGPIPELKEECGDWKVARYGADFFQQDHEKPFFLGLGIFRPHAPLLAPQEYFDKYPLEDIKLPELPVDDMNDIPETALTNFSSGFAQKLKSDSLEWKKAIQAYLACCSFADDCVGEIMNSLNNSKYNNNTIVVFWSDHGWQLGHKDRWEKQTIWNQSTHAPVIIRTPNPLHNQAIDEHVSLIDIYPTIVELLGYEIPEYLEGNSLVPLLNNAKAEWNHKAVVTNFNSHSVLWKNWNYIHYADGSEELYHHSSDPDEWNNIAGLPENKKIIEELKNAIPARK